VRLHSGELVIGKANGIEVIVMKGRLHFYEGHSMNDITFPVRMFRLLDVKKIIITNASGGINQML